ncbi:hypothetical protein CR513_49732, partial [Mucuna pruriens]
MIPTYGDFVMTKLFVGAFLTTRSIWSSSFVMQHLEAATMDKLGLPRKYLIAGSIGPPFSGTPIISSPLARSAKKLEWPLAEGMRCPSNLYCFAKSLMFGVSTSWGHSQSPMSTLIFCWSPCRFGVLKALISDQGSHFCNRAMSSLLHKYGVGNKENAAKDDQSQQEGLELTLGGRSVDI